MQPEEVVAFKRKLCFGRKGADKKGKVGLDDEEKFVDDYGQILHMVALCMLRQGTTAPPLMRMVMVCFY